MPTSGANPPPSATVPLLRISGLSAGYGKIGVLHGVDLTVGANEVVALLGPNGAGKTTLLRALSGLLPWSGGVQFDGRDLYGAGPRETAKAGLVHVVEGHRVFTQQSVFDNLLLAAYDLPRGESAARPRRRTRVSTLVRLYDTQSVAVEKEHVVAEQFVQSRN